MEGSYYFTNSPAKVTQLEDGSFWVDQQVLGLDVSVTNPLGVDVSQTAEQLVHVHLRASQEPRINMIEMPTNNTIRWPSESIRGLEEEHHLHIYDRNDALGLVKMPGYPVDRLRDKVQYQVEVHFIFLDRER